MLRFALHRQGHNSQVSARCHRVVGESLDIGNKQGVEPTPAAGRRADQTSQPLAVSSSGSSTSLGSAALRGSLVAMTSLPSMRAVCPRIE